MIDQKTANLNQALPPPDFAYLGRALSTYLSTAFGEKASWLSGGKQVVEASLPRPADTPLCQQKNGGLAAATVEKSALQAPLSSS
jgi:hypothetical protein